MVRVWRDRGHSEDRPGYVRPKPDAIVPYDAGLLRAA